MRRLLTALVIASLLVVAGPGRRAEACSCAMLDPAVMLTDADAAFVGTLIERPTKPNSPDGFSGIWIFEVDEWVKGDLGPQVGVHSSLDGASCGFEMEEGQRAGIFLYNDNGKPSGGLCSVTSPEAMVAAGKPLVFDGEGPPVFLVAADTGRARLALLDGRGRLIAAVADDRYGWSVSVCPGGARFVDLIEGEIVVRETATLNEVRILEPPESGRAERVWCLDEDATEVLGQVWTEEGTMPTLVMLGSGETVSRSDNYLIEVSGGTLATVSNPNARSVELTDLATGEQRRLDLLHQIGAVAFSPDGRSLLVTEPGSRNDGSYGMLLHLYDVETDHPTWTSDYLPYTEFGGWTDDQHIVTLTYPQNGGEPTSSIVDVTTGIVTEANLKGWQFTAAGENIISVDNGVILVADNDHSSVRLASLPTPTHRLIAVLDGEADLDIPPTTTSIEPADRTEGPEAAEPGEAEFPWYVAFSTATGVALVAAVGAFVARRRSR